MKEKELEAYKNRLIKERERVINVLDHLEGNEMTHVNVEMSSELSFYDNHTGDLANEIQIMEEGMALKENEITIIKKIDDALKDIEEGEYGICKKCGKAISKERLDFIPYAQYCVPCQNDVNEKALANDVGRPLEETVIDRPFGYGFNDYDEDDQVGYDAEDSIQDVFIFNRIEKVYDYYDEDEDYVEPIEKISNDQYRNQLPD